jgi:thioredoxin 1
MVRADTGEPIHVDSEMHLDELVRDHRLVLVDFYADWCGPCKTLEPMLTAIAAETTAVVAKVDIDELPDLAKANNVRGVPTMLLYVNSELTERLVGVRGESTLRELIASHE